MTALMYTRRVVIERDAPCTRQLRVLVAVRKLLAAVFASECTLQQRPMNIQGVSINRYSASVAD